MFTLILARMKIKVRMICGRKKINFLILEMADKLFIDPVRYFDNMKTLKHC